MTFKDLKNKLSNVQVFNDSKFDILRSKPFWIWDKQEHLKQALETKQQCCFQHIVGLPLKDGKEYPLFDYEKILYDTLIYESADTKDSFKNKHLWIKKATGLGVTEFMLRFMAWLCVKDDSYKNSQYLPNT